jgi:hypothetical protein
MRKIILIKMEITITDKEKLVCIARTYNNKTREVSRVPRSEAVKLLEAGWHFIKKGNFKRLYKRV